MVKSQEATCAGKIKAPEAIVQVMDTGGKAEAAGAGKCGCLI
jgi:hypothetical protein